MNHYLSGLQSYISNQVIQVAWQDFQKKLNEIKTIDELITAHTLYLQNALSK
jgi:hypothetical protein